VGGGRAGGARGEGAKGGAHLQQLHTNSYSRGAADAARLGLSDQH